MNTFFSAHWHQIWGIGLAVLGLYFAFRRDLPVRTRSGQILFRLTGVSAVAVSLFIVLVGIGVAADVF